MRKLAVVFALALLPLATARAQPFCPGVAPWVFADVQASDSFCTFITWMATTGVTTGCQVIDANNRLYCPDDFVTRKQMSAFMSRLGRDTVFAEGGNAFGALPNNTAVLGTADGNALDIRMYGARVMRYAPGATSPNLIGGSPANEGYNTGASIGGGGTNAEPNRVDGEFGTVSGGLGNRAGSAFFHSGNTVGGGENNSATTEFATIAGGFNNVASEWWTTVSGGHTNTASGRTATVIGGFGNVAAGSDSIAGGYKGYANHDGCIVLADSSGPNPTSCFADDEIVIRGLGGFYFWTAGNDDNTYSGARLAPGAGAWAAYSDVHGKEALEPVNSADILERLLAMPVARWQWKAEPGNVKHIGPTAQDFRTAFGLGDSDKQIVTVDADGVALAAIQGLNAKVESVVAAKDAEIAALKERLAQVETSHARDMADLRLAVEVLMAGIAGDGSMAQSR